MMPEDDWMCLDEVIDGLEGRGATSDWERMKLSLGSLSSMLSVEVVEPVVMVCWCCEEWWCSWLRVVRVKCLWCWWRGVENGPGVQR